MNDLDELIIIKMGNISLEEINETLEEKVLKLQSKMIEKDLQIELLTKRIEQLEQANSSYGPMYG